MKPSTRTLARYATGGWIARMKGGSTFPIETLVINVVGCLVIGFLAGVSDGREAFGPTARGFLFVGLLGGFTTYSAFAVDVVALGAVSGPVLGLGFGLGQVAFGLVAALLGFAVADAVRAHRAGGTT